MKQPSCRTRRLNRTFVFCSIIVLVTMLVTGVRLASDAAGPSFSPQSETPFTPAKHEPPRSLPVYHIPLRIHLDRSSRRPAAFTEILEEVNRIWWSQAGLCFEMQVVMNDYVESSGLDIWFVPRIPYFG